MVNLTSSYSAGDIVVFEKNGTLYVGMVVGMSFNIRSEAPVWYSVSVNKKFTFNVGNGGEVPEEDIIGKISDETIRSKAFDFIV